MMCLHYAKISLFAGERAYVTLSVCVRFEGAGFVELDGLVLVVGGTLEFITDLTGDGGDEL